MTIRLYKDSAQAAIVMLGLLLLSPAMAQNASGTPSAPNAPSASSPPGAPSPAGAPGGPGAATAPSVQGAPGAPGASSPCKADIQTYCSGSQPGEGRIAACLKENDAKLSFACKQNMDRVLAIMQQAGAACEDDIHLYCANSPPTGAAPCLRANFRRLTPGCMAEVSRAAKAK